MLQGLPNFRWLTYLAALPTLTLAFGVSIVLHSVVLSIHFKLPEALDRARQQALDVILVNSKHAAKPVKAQAKAQANLDAGGNTEAPVRAKTPLPPTRQAQPGNDVIAAQQRIVQLEKQQREMMTRPGTERTVRVDGDRLPRSAEIEISGRDLVTSARAMVRMEAEIARSIEEYNQRPKRKFLGARVEEYRFAQYVEDWRHKVERIGNLNYPPAAKGKLYGNLVLTVAIKNDGNLERVELNRSSGHKLLDDAALRIVRMAAPYAVFPDAIRRDTDIIEITRTWSFTGTDQLQTN
jgi:protein TonB